MANNHAMDFGQGIYDDTAVVLSGAGIANCGDNETLLYTTDSGLVVGVYAVHSGHYPTVAQTVAGVNSLKDQGAEVIVVTAHWGNEASYYQNANQIEVGRAAIDAGAHIVVGHGPHRSEPVEEYNGGVIYYSLGNFSFGGNGNPQDKDSAIIQQKVIRDKDGNVTLGETILIPFSVTSTPGTNDYKPIPFEVGTLEYDRCMEKLTGTYKGPDLQPLNLGNEEEEEEPEAPQPPEDSGSAEAPEENEGEGTTEDNPSEDGNESDLPENEGDAAPPESSGESGETTPPPSGDESSTTDETENS